MSASASSLGPLPVVIGVTGHRDLRDKDRPALEKLVGEFFDDLRKRCPHTPILVACQLAEGADRLAAKKAMASGAKLVAALPMVQGLFESDFASQESKAEFRDLARQAAIRFSVPLAEGCTLENIRDEGPYRSKQYAAAGTWVVEHCDILVALWDGADRRLVGGTDHIVRMASGRHPVLHIYTPRASKPTPADATPSAKMTGGEIVEKPYETTLAQIEDFNTAAARYHVSDELELATATKTSLLPESAQVLSRNYALLATMAKSAAVGTRKPLARALQVTVAAVLALFAYAAVWPNVAVGVLAVVLLGVAALLLKQQGSLTEQQRRARDYEALSDAVSVQFYWKAAGVEDAVTDWFLRGHRGTWIWMQRALSAWNFPVAGEKTAGVSDVRRVMDEWLRASRHEDASKCPGAGPFIVGAVALSAVAVVVGIFPRWGNIARGILVALAGGSLASAAAVRICVLDTVGGAKGQIGDLLARARERANAYLERNDPAGAKRAVRDAGRDVLAMIESDLRLGATGK